MAKRYSRLARLEEKKNIRKAVTSIVLAIALLALLVVFGIPAIAKFAAFISDLRKSGQPVDVSDTTPPAPPKLESLPEYTSEVSLEIKGETEPGATAIIVFNSDEEEVLADKDGEFSAKFRLRKGGNALYAFAKDPAGNESTETKEYRIVYDKEPPDLEIISPSDDQEFFGSRQRQVTIEGQTEEAAKVFIRTPETSEGDERLVVVDLTGKFSFTTSLVEGENPFVIIAKDRAENSTEISLTLNFTP